MAPRWIVGILERVVPDDECDDVVGDLEELHGRRLARRGRVYAALATGVEGVLLVCVHALRAAGRALRGEQWISPMELRLALRLIVKQPIMTLTSVVALGVGIGIAAGGFSTFRQGLYSDLPFENGDRWVVIETYSEKTGRRSRLDLERLRVFREAAPYFVYIGGLESQELNVVHESGEVERVGGARVTPGVFGHLPYVPVAGRLLSTSDGRSGGEPVALIRASLWERTFGGDPGVLSRSLDIAGQDHRIVGVLADDAGYPSEGEIWIPLDEETMGAEGDRSPLPGSRQVAILADGASTEQATVQLARLSEDVAAAGRGAEAQRHRITPMTRTIASGQGQVIVFGFVTALVLVLLVIAVNVSNLIAARTSRRASELAVRTALGASRSRIVTQLFVEVCAIAVLASVLGLACAGFVLSVYDRVIDELPFWVHLQVDPATGAAVVALALLASAVMGLIPALRATGTDPAPSLREAGARSSPGIGRLGGAMIVAEVALSVALLGAGLVFAEGFRAYIDPAFNLPDDRVLTARFTLDVGEEDLREGGSPTVADSIATVVDRLEEALARLPGVTSVGFASHLPRAAPFPEMLVVEGRGDLVTAPVAYQGPGLFAVLEVEPILGRDFHERDLDPGAPPVVLVNQAFAVEHFGTTQVLGRRLRMAPHSDEDPEAPWSEIVGVVPNVMEVTAARGGAVVYLPLVPARFLSAAMNVQGDPLALTGMLRRAAYDVDPDLNVTEIVRLDDVGAENRTALSAMSGAMVGIGLITLLLSLAGVYSIVSLSVTRRTREIGVRVALGAESGSILWSILRRSTGLVLGGALVGAVAGIGFSQMRLFTFAVPEPRPWLFPALMASMALAGVLACWVPARRALTIQPVEALRYDT